MFSKNLEKFENVITSLSFISYPIFVILHHFAWNLSSFLLDYVILDRFSYLNVYIFLYHTINQCALLECYTRLSKTVDFESSIIELHHSFDPIYNLILIE